MGEAAWRAAGLGPSLDMSPLRAVILDVDGTLVDSNEAHAHAWVEAFAERGRRVELATVRRLIGMGADKLIPAATGLDPGHPTLRGLSERRAAIFAERWLATVRAQPGARELLVRLRRDDRRLVVASSARPEELAPLLAIAGVEGLIEAKTSGDEVAGSKPDPDVVAAARARLGVRPEEAIMLGDTPYDVIAARAAGVATIAVRCGGWSDAELAGAVAIYDHPADLLVHVDESPLRR
jgi:HAD superfamily hydrolase (TIGR01509 family)